MNDRCNDVSGHSAIKKCAIIAQFEVEKIMNRNNKKVVKHYIFGAISAFSVVAAYKAYKIQLYKI